MSESATLERQKSIKLTLPEEEIMSPGHLACQGCGAALACAPNAPKALGRTPAPHLRGRSAPMPPLRRRNAHPRLKDNVDKSLLEWTVWIPRARLHPGSRSMIAEGPARLSIAGREETCEGGGGEVQGRNKAGGSVQLVSHFL